MPHLFIALLFLGAPAEAVLRSAELLGASVVRHEGRSELCLLPLHLPGKYSEKDAKHEAELCGYNIGENVAACPKLNSSNPGVIFAAPPVGMSVEELTRRECAVDGAKKEAKFKLSISCSYSPSILAYYHVSRALGNIVNVPVAVLRTLDLQRHKNLATRGIQLLKNNQELSIYRWWARLQQQLTEGQAGARADFLFTDDFQYTYGALQKNPKGEVYYREFNDRGVDRPLQFKNHNQIYASLIRQGKTFSREFTFRNMQGMRQLKDAADFILLDTLLSQQDRFGNVHYKVKFYFLADENGKVSLKSEDTLEKVPEKFRGKALAVKEMLLKDNDCGVDKDPTIKAAKLLDAIAHIDPKTYRHLQELDQLMDKPETKNIFLRGMNFTEADYRRVSRNVHEAASMLKHNCRTRRLALDLNLEAHFSGKPLAYECGE